MGVEQDIQSAIQLNLGCQYFEGVLPSHLSGFTTEDEIFVKGDKAN